MTGNYYFDKKIIRHKWTYRQIKSILNNRNKKYQFHLEDILKYQRFSEKDIIRYAYIWDKYDWGIILGTPYISAFTLDRMAHNLTKLGWHKLYFRKNIPEWFKTKYRGKLKLYKRQFNVKNRNGLDCLPIFKSSQIFLSKR